MKKTLFIRSAIFLIFLLLFLVVSKKSVGQTREYTIKAALFEKISKYANWPSKAGLSRRNSSFVIAVLGENPFQNSLRLMYKDKTIKNRKVKILFFRTIEDYQPCHILFVSRYARKELQAALDLLSGEPVLMISDTKGWAAKGIHINFFIDSNNTVQLEINPSSLKKTGLYLDPLLLDYARIVNR